MLRQRRWCQAGWRELPDVLIGLKTSLSPSPPQHGNTAKTQHQQGGRFRDGTCCVEELSRGQGRIGYAKFIDPAVEVARVARKVATSPNAGGADLDIAVVAGILNYRR